MTLASIVPLSRLNIERDPSKEGAEDAEAVMAYDRSNRWLPFSVLRGMVLRRLEKDPPRGWLLDAGCGPGYLAIAIGERFPGLCVTGLDINPDMMDAAERNVRRSQAGNIDFQPGDVHRIPYGDDSLDFILSTLSLHHWQDGAFALAEIRRVLRPGGRLLLMDLRRDCARWFYWGLVLMQRFIAPAAIRRTNGAVGSVFASYTVEELGGMLDGAGFRDARIEPAPGWMFAAASK